MKVNIFTASLVLIITILISFFFSSYITEENKWILSIGSFLAISLTLIGLVSISFEYERTTVLTKTTSGIFFALTIVTQIFFLILDNFRLPTYLLSTGGIIMLYLLVVYIISRSKI